MLDATDQNQCSFSNSTISKLIKCHTQTKLNYKYHDKLTKRQPNPIRTTHPPKLLRNMEILNYCKYRPAFPSSQQLDNNFHQS